MKNNKEANCQRCVHLLICEWAADQAGGFNLPENGGSCDMMNADFDDAEEMVSSEQAGARAMMNKFIYEKDRVDRYYYYKGRHDALKDVLRFMSERGHKE